MRWINKNPMLILRTTIKTNKTALLTMLLLSILPVSLKYLFEKATGDSTNTVDRNNSSFLCDTIFKKSPYPSNKKRMASAILHIKKLASSAKTTLNKTELDTPSIAKNTIPDTRHKTQKNARLNNLLRIKPIPYS